jgi:hypothetical protein
VSQDRVSQSSLKTGGDTTRMVHMTSTRRLRGDKIKDGWVNAMCCIELFYPNFVVFIILSHKGSLVINFPIIRILMAGGEVSTQSSLSHSLAIIAFLDVWVCFMV